LRASRASNSSSPSRTGDPIERSASAAEHSDIPNARDSSRNTGEVYIDTVRVQAAYVARENHAPIFIVHLHHHGIAIQSMKNIKNTFLKVLVREVHVIAKVHGRYASDPLDTSST